MATLDLGSFASKAAVFRRIASRKSAFWLDNSLDKQPSFMGFDACSQLRVAADGRVHLLDGGVESELRLGPLEAIEAFVGEGARRAGAALSWLPHTVGFLSYDLAPWIEHRMRVPCDGEDAAPLVHLARYDAVTAIEPRAAGDGGFNLTIHATSRAAAQRAASAFAAPLADADATPPRSVPAGVLLEAPEYADYARGVQRALAYIRAGDVYQVNLAERLQARSAAPPAEVYLGLRREQPVPHGVYLDCGDLVLLCNSPERFLRVHGARIETEPIKGTRRRASDAREDAALARELARDAKERAEHVMIVDLERSDLGRICAPGSVRVSSLMRVESFATLHHLVSTVEGRLRDDVDLAAILRATFPGGSITGAPKIRASEIIAELEPRARGPYTGAVFWFSGPRDFDSVIAIRTMVAREDRYVYHAGGGIVADSDPRREFAECWLKARPFLAATLGPEAAAQAVESAA
ncbi:MAG TPA: aminodeoxychorismate synthase component I [Candidatus Bathyarchaeia archaeon]|nr:aminodeoxychorismate synthase component I [Candidatus Bathyarchaeia archaeon]